MQTTTTDRTSSFQGPLDPAADAEVDPACFHCGLPIGAAGRSIDEKAFCCAGCETVYRLLEGAGLDGFYQVESHPGVRMENDASAERFQFLDDPEVRRQFVDYADEKITRVTFTTPAIHCAACIWLLENLFRLNPGIERSRVNFTHKEVSIGFSTGDVRLSEIAALLSSLGYEPELRLSDAGVKTAAPTAKRAWLRVGVAGFAFGNVMLFSFPGYLGLSVESADAWTGFFGWASLLIALPSVTYSAGVYWLSALSAIRARRLNIDVPIALGMAALLGQSLIEVFSGAGCGYLDSLTGLIFFLLCGRSFQQKTYDRLSFERDYKSFFPLSTTRVTGKGEESAGLSTLRVGDRLRIRNGELIPADARLVSGAGLIDYSFVTGESQPVEKRIGDHVHAGGRQKGASIEIETEKPVSQSYLTSLWNQDAFLKPTERSFVGLADRFGQYFTFAVLGVAGIASLVWLAIAPTAAPLVFTSILIVACPCALALSAPFAFGSAIRQLGRANVFVKNASVIERLAQSDAVVFDKTGTLTEPGEGDCRLRHGEVTAEEAAAIGSLARESAHPLAHRLGSELADAAIAVAIEAFTECPGKGVKGTIREREFRLGSAAWLQEAGISVPNAADQSDGARIHISIDGQFRGTFTFQNRLRQTADQLLTRLAATHELHLLSGDTDRERARFEALFANPEALQFEQSPANKLAFIRDLQENGRRTIMAGDGLNDAGALKQADVGISVVEEIGAFSPASDVIMTGRGLCGLDAIQRFARNSVRIVKASFAISILYNVVGVSIAAQGLLSPVFCAILMPLSSITVVSFAVLATSIAARLSGIHKSGRGA